MQKVFLTCVGRILKRFLHVILSLENLSSGENRAKHYELQKWRIYAQMSYYQGELSWWGSLQDRLSDNSHVYSKTLGRKNNIYLLTFSV